MEASDLRRIYAENLRKVAALHADRVVPAFSAVPREHFLGAGPWQISQPFDELSQYRTTPDAELEHVYQDVAIALDAEKLLNNGQPSAHACWIDAVDPKPGESVLHVGCGTGHYTAILAEMAGPRGNVTAYEVDPGLATRARSLLQPWPQVRVENGDASKLSRNFDVIYINAGATHPRFEWLRALNEGARLLLPLTVHLPTFPHGVGFVIATKRLGDKWPVSVASPVGIFDCVGARDDATERELRKLLRPEAAARIRWLRVDPHERGANCLVHRADCCLQAD